MKRLNPETGRPFRAGDTRDDGMVFVQYKNLVKKDGYFAEGWVRAEVYRRSLSVCKKQARAIALEQGKKHYFTGKPCVRGHLSDRIVTTRKCMACDREDKARRALTDPVTHRENRARSYVKNRDKILVAKKQYRDNNKAKILALCTKRKKYVAERTPAWLDVVDKAEIASIYEYCAALRSCGLDYHVDHIIPLRGKTVSGLHVPSNLQVMYSKDNIAKKNRWDNA
jgi:hypothetical protein